MFGDLFKSAVNKMGEMKKTTEEYRREMAGKSERYLLQIYLEEGGQIGSVLKVGCAVEELKNRGWDMESIKEKAREMRSGK